MRLASVDELQPAAAPPPRAAFTAQLEYDRPLYLTLGARQLDSYASALAHAWTLSGVARGDRVAIFDYGTSPLAYLASSCFTPYLRRGAADLTGCVPICNDGVSQMSGRAVEIARYVRPRLWVVRADCLHPFADELRRQGLDLAESARAVLVAENEGAAERESLRPFERAFGVPVRRLLHLDAALALATECPACSLFHARSDLYGLAVAAGEQGAAEGWLAVDCRFARPWGRVRYLSRLWARLHPGGCHLGPGDLRFEV